MIYVFVIVCGCVGVSVVCVSGLNVCDVLWLMRLLGGVNLSDGVLLMNVVDVCVWLWVVEMSVMVVEYGWLWLVEFARGDAARDESFIDVGFVVVFVLLRLFMGEDVVELYVYGLVVV